MNPFISEAQLIAYVEKQAANRKEFESRTEGLVLRYLENESTLFLFQFKANLEASNQLGELESIYDIAQETRLVYSRCKEIFIASADKAPQGQIQQILRKTVDVFDQTLMTLPQDVDNPIALERIRCIGEAVDDMKQVFRREIHCYMAESYEKEPIWEEAQPWLLKIISGIMQNSLAEAEDIHKKALGYLNRYDARIHGKRYIHALLQAKEGLEPLLTDYRKVLETEPADPWVEKTLTGVYQILAEIHKRIAGIETQEMGYINHIHISVETIHRSFMNLLETCDGMAPAMTDAGLVAQIDAYFTLKKRLFDEMANNAHEVFKVLSVRAIHNMCRTYKKFEQMGVGLCWGFSQSSEKCQQMKEHNPQDPMAEGILQALSIKAQLLQEKNRLYSDLKTVHIETDERTLILLGNKLLEHLVRCFEEMCHAQGDPLEEMGRQFERLIKEMERGHLKQDIAYLKHDLLPEINTFEDLVNQTLPKLQSSGLDTHKPLIAEVVNLNKLIQNLVRKAGIKTIKPMNHERFNGKDQEIILVEAQEGYSKGEIIKVHTKGYKYADIAVQRAQVIVAG